MSLDPLERLSKMARGMAAVSILGAIGLFGVALAFFVMGGQWSEDLTLMVAWGGGFVVLAIALFIFDRVMQRYL